jgi:nicotinate dehydrogenase subunit A
MKIKITIQINKQQHVINVDPATPLLYVLRNQLELNGPKYGCGYEQCGSCMVLMNNKAVPSCMLPVSNVKDASIITLEGLTGKNGELHPIQQAFVQAQAAQCGYCLNGMVISAVALLQENKSPDDEAIRNGMQRMLCRCGSQARVVRAIKLAANGAIPQE